MAEKKGDLLIEQKESIVTITLNRPEQMNALNVDLCRDLRKAFENILWDESCKVVILSGRGEKSFSAGVDLKERSKMSEEEILLTRERDIIPLYHYLGDFPKPLIGAVNGMALGGGAELALVCDTRIAVPQARFGQTEIRWGMIPSAGACQRLRHIAGVSAAKELILTGRIIEAEEALNLGIYDRVVPSGELVGAALDLADEMARHSSIALRQAKRVLNFGMDIGTVSAFDLEASKECFYRGKALKGHKSFS
jgi:enoyl-CoA hydratase/carnithine racemase